MAGTTLQDVIVPELFNPYVINQTMALSALVQSGIISNDSTFDALASQAAPTVNMPFFEDLTGESEQVIEGADLAGQISSLNDLLRFTGQVLEERHVDGRCRLGSQRIESAVIGNDSALYQCGKCHCLIDDIRVKKFRDNNVL